jgi:thiol-disulfide isomerase/thioredoxin
MSPRSLLRPSALSLAAALALLSEINLSSSSLRAESAPVSAASAEALPVLGESPAWNLVTLDGKSVGRDELKGKTVVVDFWATWCGPCIHEIPGYVALQKKYADRGLVIVGVSVDRKGETAVPPFAKKMSINYPLALATPEVIEAFGGIEAIPTTFLIDREGKIRHRKVGAMETEDYEKLLLPLL